MKALLRTGILLFLFFSCSQAEKSKVYTLQEEQETRIFPQEGILDDLFCAEQICIKDSLLLFIDRCDSCLLHVYDTKQGKLVYAFGAKGQGPNDFLYPLFLSTYRHPDSVYGYDANQHLLKSIAWASIESGQVTNVNNAAISESVCGSPCLTSIGKDYWGISDYMHNGLFFRYSEDKDSITWYDYPESILKHSDDLGLQARICVNTNTKAVAVGMRYFNRLFLYDGMGKLAREIRIGPNDISPDYNKKQKIITDNSILCCQQIQATDSLVYVLQSGWPECELENDAYTSRILVFDWGLNYQKTYRLPHKAICFAIDESSNTLAYTGLKGDQCVVATAPLD